MAQRNNTELLDNLRPLIAQMIQRQIRRHELDDGSARYRPPDKPDGVLATIGNPHTATSALKKELDVLRANHEQLKKDYDAYIVTHP